MQFTESVRSCQVPATPGTCAWPPRLPSVPTSRATRVTSSAKARQLVDHRVDGVLQLQDLAARVDVIFWDRSPRATAVVTWAMLRHLGGQVAGHGVDGVGEVPPGAGDAGAPAAWPPSRPSVPTSRATRVTSSANDDSWSTIVLTVFFSSSISPRDVDGDLLRQVAVGHRRRHLGDVADLAGEVAGHAVLTESVRSFQVPADARHLRPGRPARPRRRPPGRPG